MTVLTPEIGDAASELLRRRLARQSLLGFTQFTFPGYQAEPVHELIASTLDKVVAGEIKRLMIFSFPQSGKSELVSVRLPAYWLAMRPDDPVIICSYAASLAESKSRQARQVIESPECQQLFPDIMTRKDSRSVSHWELDGFRGRLIAAGVGGPITGFGSLLSIVDDPIENWQESQSKVVRDTCWDWYRSTFRTRVWEGGAVVLVMTRWSDDDLAGRLLREQPGQWTVLRLPAIAETQWERDQNNRLLGLPLGEADPLGRMPGAPLCPRRFSLAALESLKRDVGSLSWSGQYQGVPRAPEGNRFKRAWFTIVQEVPFQGRRVRYWDRAASADSGDWTVGVLMVKGDDGLYYVEDVVRGQWSTGERDKIMKQTADLDALRYGNVVHIWVEQEPGSGGKESVENAMRLLAGYPCHADKVTGSKEVRAEPFAAQAEAGNVRLLRGAWNGAYIDELCSFPNGTHDDAVDSSSGAFNKLALGKVIQPVRVISLGPRKDHKQLKIAVCSHEQLRQTTIEGRVVLVLIDNPGDAGEHPFHGLILDRVQVEFADMDPTSEPRNGTVGLFDPNVQGKQIWRAVVKQRNEWPEYIVVADPGDRRALSVGYALCDTMQLSRKSTMYRIGVDDWQAGEKDMAPNRFVYERMREARGKVV